MKCQFPSEEEQKLVKRYVLERKIVRPDITYKKVVIKICILLITTFLISLLFYKLFFLIGFSLLSKELKTFIENHLSAYRLVFYLLCYLIVICILSKKITINLLHLYQHYSSENVRRRCLLKPTCSEYALLSINKNGVFIGIIKTLIRLKLKCRGNVYYIDEP